MIFTERIPTVVVSWGRSTTRLTEVQQAIGLVVGGTGGAKLCKLLAIPVSVDTLLAQIHQLGLATVSTPWVLGVDDWALRKGQTYGTILVDLEKGNVIDLLPDRTAERLKASLKAHPGVEIVSRDREGAYAEGVKQGAPDAIQVADRWHLLKNLTDAVYKILQKHQTAVEKMVTAESSAATAQKVSVEDGQYSTADLARQQRVGGLSRSLVYSLLMLHPLSAVLTGGVNQCAIALVGGSLPTAGRSSLFGTGISASPEGISYRQRRSVKGTLQK